MLHHLSLVCVSHALLEDMKQARRPQYVMNVSQDASQQPQQPRTSIHARGVQWEDMNQAQPPQYVMHVSQDATQQH